MTSELGETTDVSRLVSGSVGAARAIADAHRAQAGVAAERATASRKASAVEWEGAAATAFRAAAAAHGRRCIHEEAQFRRTSAALDAFADALDSGRRRATTAVDLWLDAEATTASARSAHDRLVRSAARPPFGGPTVVIVPPFVDPGEALRGRAIAELAGARAMVDRAEAAAVEALQASASSAPAQPLFAAQQGFASDGPRDAVRPASAVIPFPGPASTATQIAAWLTSGAYSFAQLIALCGPAAVMAAIPLITVAGVGSGSTARGTRAEARARRIALAEARIWAWTHYPDGTLRERAGIEGVDEPGFRNEEGPQSAEEVKEIVNEKTAPGKNKPHRQVDSVEELRELYDAVTRGGKPIEDPSAYRGGGNYVELPDGTGIGWRNSSKSGGPTIDIEYPGRTVKVHLPTGWGR